MIASPGPALWFLILASAATLAQQPVAPVARPSDLPPPLSTPGPLFVTPEAALRHPTTVIAYGDMRFTDPANVTATSPYARRAIVARIVEEHPDAVLLSGDIPYRGGVVADYTQYAIETEPWRTANLRVYPALGNHEFAGCVPAICLHNWWTAFPELNYRRWYGAQLGASLYAIALDSDTSLLPGSDQRQWLELQIKSLPKSIRFVFISLHHPPVADVQTRYQVDHNPRPNEISLADYLKSIAPASRARFIVVAGHTHNYERFLQGGVIYFVSGGGGAQPYPIDRSPDDLYKDASFPNYHFLRFVLVGDRLRGTMFRLASTDGATPVWEAKDTFEIKAK